MTLSVTHNYDYKAGASQWYAFGTYWQHKYSTSTHTIYALYPTNRLIAPKVRAFVDHLAREIKARGVFA